MSLTRRVYGGKKSRNSKKGRGHCRIGGKKTLKKGGKRVLSFGGKSLKNRKKSKRRSKRGGASFVDGTAFETFEGVKLAQLNPTQILMTPGGAIGLTLTNDELSSGVTFEGNEVFRDKPDQVIKPGYGMNNWVLADGELLPYTED